MLDFEGRNYRDFVVKVVLVGDPAVGKTSLRKRYLGKGFETSYLPTLGADFAIKQLKFEDNVTVHARIWDLAGQQSFKKVRKHYLNNANGALLVFDLSRIETFNSLPEWLEDIHKVVLFPFQKIPMVVIGNKSDLENRAISEIEIKTFIDNLRGQGLIISYLETSAKTGQNVPVVFESVCKEIVRMKLE